MKEALLRSLRVVAKFFSSSPAPGLTVELHCPSASVATSELRPSDVHARHNVRMRTILCNLFTHYTKFLPLSIGYST